MPETFPATEQDVEVAGKLALMMIEWVGTRPDPYLWCIAPTFGSELAALGRKRLGARWSARYLRLSEEKLTELADTLDKQASDLLDSVADGLAECCECGGAEFTRCILRLKPANLYFEVVCHECSIQ